MTLAFNDTYVNSTKLSNNAYITDDWIVEWQFRLFYFLLAKFYIACFIVLCAKAESSVSRDFILIDSIIARFEGELQRVLSHLVVSNETSLILLSRYLDAIQRRETLMIAHAELNEIMCYHRRSIGLTLIRGLLLYTGTSHGAWSLNYVTKLIRKVLP